MNKRNGATKGGKVTRLYRIWMGIHGRCRRKTDAAYHLYGGRGVEVKGWGNFESFEAWALNNGYEESLQIDRIDPDGNYTSENCRWVTSKENNNNRRDNKRYDFFGESLTCGEAGTKFNFDRTLIRSRIVICGMTPEEAVTFPKQNPGHRIRKNRKGYRDGP
jgi:hypothetical protein